MMTRWNALTASQKGIALGLAVVVVLAAFVFGAFQAGVRCHMKGSYFTCAKAGLSEAGEQGSQSEESGDTMPLSESENRPEPVVAGDDTVVVNDQPAGPVVEVTMLTLSEPGWVVVYEDNNGALGNALGAGRFEEGIHLGEIPLLRSTAPGRTYHLVLHADVSERVFDIKKNPLLTDENGTSIRATFRTFAD